ncbi:hypothetical protein, partial [Thiolapillus sp.]
KQKQKIQKEESVKYTHIINMNPNINKVHNKIKLKKEYTQSQISRCEITIMVMNSRVKHETEHKTMEI